MTTVKLCDFLLSSGEAKALLCPRCKARKLEVIVVEHVKKHYICKLVCVSVRCRRKVAYDVSGGFPEAK